MRRIVAIGVAVFALLGVLTPRAFAQAPTPTFKINGLFDNLTSYSRNSSNEDADFGRTDKQWYARERGRLDFTGEYGKTKAVLGIEIDAVYGQTGSADSNIPTTTSFTQFGASGGFDINTDVRAIIEIKWLYTEFEAPLIPWPTTVRVGAQPFGSIPTYKLAVYAASDFPGVAIISTITPNVKLNLAYVAAEERLVGTQGCSPASNTQRSGTCQGIPTTESRGDDWAIIVSPEITPFKGLDIKPMYSYFNAIGTTSGSARQPRGGVDTSTSFINPVRGNGFGIGENRHTVGIDMRWRSGPWSLDPTVMYQFGNRDVVASSAFINSGRTPGKIYQADLDAWFIDVRGGYQIGPLLLEGLLVYTSGNSVRNDTLGTVRYYQPLTTDTSYLADWGTQLTSLGLDYFQAFNEAGRFVPYTGVSIGYDKYGRKQAGIRATYNLTPSVNFGAGITTLWTDTGVGSHATISSSALTPNFKSPGGKAYYIGTEPFLSVGWKFAPGVSWDNAFGYLFAGNVLDVGASNKDAKDATILTSRIRFTF